MSEMYKIIENLCQGKAISVTRLCKDTNIPRTVFSELKSGRTKQLSNKYLPVVAEYFGVTVDYLLGNEVNDKLAVAEDNELAEILEDIRRNPDLRAMFSLTKNATPEQVRQYIDVIKAIRGEGKNE